jgi:hypothetical protein
MLHQLQPALRFDRCFATSACLQQTMLCCTLSLRPMRLLSFSAVYQQETDALGDFHLHSANTSGIL